MCTNIQLFEIGIIIHKYILDVVILQNAAHNDATLFGEMIDHAENELSSGTWRLIGWWKAVSTVEDNLS